MVSSRARSHAALPLFCLARTGARRGSASKLPSDCSSGYHFGCGLLPVCVCVCGSSRCAPAALNVGHLCGSIDVGKYGDLVVLDVPSWEHVIYEMGDGVPIAHVFKKGLSVRS